MTISTLSLTLNCASCIMRRNLIRVTDYFEQTAPRSVPVEFKDLQNHFRITKETFAILSGNRPF